MNLIANKNLILASKSPRRAELLRGLGLDFSVSTKTTEETYPDELPLEEVAGFLSKKKVEAFKNNLKPNDLVITADTVVILEGRILGKPKDKQEAFEMLAALSGSEHQVITGVSLMDNKKKITFQDVVKVYFNTLSNEEIYHYINNSKPFDKAGAYGIQEWIGYVAVQRIEGSFYTVMGLPVHRVYQELKKW